MIMTGADGRKEVDLLPPAPPPLPTPVCPSVVIASADVDPLPPGASPLDEGLDRLHSEGGVP
jgi:hypothetical protein